MKLRRFLAVTMAVLILLSVGVPAVSAETQALIDEPNSAIDSLEAPVASGDEIPFTLVQECRVQYYYPDSGSELHLVKSVEEMDAVLDTIHGSPDDKWEPKPVRDEKYNDEYFTENALVIGLYVFGSGSERQSIDMLAVDGDTLTVHRNIYYPEAGTDDMMLRYALMEVKNSDIEGVVNVVDSYAVASFDWNEKVYGLWGDVNNDNTLNIKDATAVQKHIAGIHLLYSANLYLADANGDGDVNIKDATEIQKCIAEIKLASCVGKLTKVCLPVIHYDTEVALTELYYTIRDAKNQIVPGSNFVSSTVSKLMDEIEKAEELYESVDPNYNNVVEQTAALNEAIEGLEIVDLDTSELVPLMNEADGIIYRGGYTDSSLEVLKEANFNAQMVCLYGQTQDEVTQATSELRGAMDALVPAPDPEATAIDFTVAQECRVLSYGTSDTQLYLVKSPAEMDEVLATIEGQNTAVYTKPERDEKYNEEFFAENSLVISLNTLVDGAESGQDITKVTVKGDTLTVCRTVVVPYDESNNKKCQYVLLEVANADIEGVTKLENGTEFVYVVCGLPVVNEDIPFEIAQERRVEGYAFDVEGDKDKVYLVNSVEEMDSVLATIYDPKPVRDEKYNDEFFEENSLIISLSFLGGSCCEQTIDRLSRVGSTLTLHRTVNRMQNPTPDMNYQYVLLEVSNGFIDGADTITEDVETVIVPEKTEPVEISFTEVQQCKVQGWGELYDDNQQEIYIVRNVAEFDAVLEYIEGSPEDTFRAKPVRDEKYDDLYFMSDALVVCLYPMGSGSYTFSTDKLTIDGENLIIHRTIYMPTISDCEVVCHYALIEVNAFDVAQVKNISVETAEQWVQID
ncbi:MAG: dockerin type I repeat-containing protein [Ruminococcus sp.]|nr:dockerin type I repeat-containing protein [Ruminococcus sp.]